ncbi:MAG: GNAT family N-acetyltransferase [Stenotrophomonas sp.]
MTLSNAAGTQPQVVLNPDVIIRAEVATDADAIGLLTQLAFAPLVHSSGTEQFIVAALRRADRLAISLVATSGLELIGHVAISPVILSTKESGWYGLGPLSVHPRWQKQGVGPALVHAALSRMRDLQIRGCVVLGDPVYYARFGFKTWPGFSLPDVPAEYFQALAFGCNVPRAAVSYHAAFLATE